MMKPDSLCAGVLKGKYYHYSDFCPQGGKEIHRMFGEQSYTEEKPFVKGSLNE